MELFSEIKPTDLRESYVKLIGQDWALLTAEKNGVANTMTISWGQFGVMWGMDVVVVGVRPQRFTKEFVDAASAFSVSFFDSSFKDTLSYLGTVSGRDEPKIEKSGLTLCQMDGTPAFAEAHTIITAEKVFAQPLLEESFLQTSTVNSWYPEKDFHTLYFGRILSVRVRN